MFALIVVCLVGYRVGNNYSSAISSTKEWARLDDFPPSATNITVSDYGSMFTRGFTIEFDGQIDEIVKWLSESPGTRGITPIIDRDVHKYQIDPGGGAQFAELEFDTNGGHVRIRAYWS